MSRLSTNEIVNGHLKNGYDYQLQCWVLNYIIQDCGHPEGNLSQTGIPCHCNGRKFKNQDIREVNQ